MMLLLEKLGEGTYGIVWKAKDIYSKEIVALKLTKPSDEEDGIPGRYI